MKKVDSGPIGTLKRIYLKFAVNYRDPQQHWNQRYRLNLKSDLQQELAESERHEIAKFDVRIKEVMQAYGCNNILEVGCGRGKHRNLNGWTGLDFSSVALKQSGLTEYIVADFTRHIPLPDKSFDCVMCQSVLLHVPPEKIRYAVFEMQRVASKLIILAEPQGKGDAKKYSFNHDLKELFKGFMGKTVYLNELGESV